MAVEFEVDVIKDTGQLLLIPIKIIDEELELM